MKPESNEAGIAGPEPSALEMELRVLSGIHRGAALLLIDEAIVLGSDPDCDVVLLDEGIQMRHLVIVRRDEQWWCEALEKADATTAQGKALEAAVVIKPNFKLCAAGVWIGFSLLEDPWESESELTAMTGANARGDARATGVAATNAKGGMIEQKLQQQGHPLKSSGVRRAGYLRIALFIFPGAALVSLLVGAMFNMSMGESEDEQRVGRAPPAMPKPDTQRSPEQLQKQAFELLKDAQLDDAVRITTAPGRLFMEGELTTQERARFEQALLAMQRRFGANTLIEAKLTPLSSALPFRIHQILMGPDSHIVLSDGRQMYLGDEVAGFRLLSVRAGKLFFAGHRKVEVSW